MTLQKDGKAWYGCECGYNTQNLMTLISHKEKFGH